MPARARDGREYESISYTPERSPSRSRRPRLRHERLLERRPLLPAGTPRSAPPRPSPAPTPSASLPKLPRALGVHALQQIPLIHRVAPRRLRRHHRRGLRRPSPQLRVPEVIRRAQRPHVQEQPPEPAPRGRGRRSAEASPPNASSRIRILPPILLLLLALLVLLVVPLLVLLVDGEKGGDARGFGLGLGLVRPLGGPLRVAAPPDSPPRSRRSATRRRRASRARLPGLPGGSRDRRAAVF